MSNFNKLYKYANNYVKLAQTMPQPDQEDYPMAIYKAKLSPWGTSSEGTLEIDYNSAAFSSYINPTLDSAGTEGKVNIMFSVNTDLSVSIKVNGDPTSPKVQASLQSTWGNAMSQALKKAGVIRPTAPILIGTITNYG